MDKVDWNFIIKLIISSGVGLALLRWAGPVLLRQIVRDAISDVLKTLETHDERLGKNELGIQAHSLQMSKIESTIVSLERDRELIKDIHADVKQIVNEFGSIKIAVAVLQDRWDGKDRRHNA